jgi:phospho-N-acetylmuramoyl-pentapeptide-transferase
MLYLLYERLADHHHYVPVLNLLRYLTFRSGMAVITAQLTVVAMGSRFIRWMQAGRARASRSAPTASSATWSKRPARRPWAG